MLKKLNGKLNPKIAKKISRYLIEEKFTYEQYHEETNEFKIIHDNFVEFLNTDLSFESIHKILSILEVRTEIRIINGILKKIRNIKESEIIDFFILSYIENTYGKETLILLKLIFNKWLYDNDYSLFILYPSFRKELESVIEYGGDIFVMRELIISFYNDSLVRNNIYKIKNTQDLIEDILKVKITLQKQYNVEKLFIFGSYSKDKQNEFSDLDIYLNMVKKPTIYELESINDYLSQLLELKVNVVVDSDFIHYQMLEVF